MAEAKVIIKSENNISAGLKSAQNDLKQFGNVTQTIGSTLSKAFSVTAIITAVKKLIDVGKQCIQEYSEAEKVALRLDAVWKNVGNTTGRSYKQIMEYADALEKSTYFTGEAVEESALLLAATKSLTEEGFDRALNASADLAAALGEDMTSAASTLAKALEDPSAALTRLRTIGITFTDEETERIKALVDANEAYEAQALILEKVEERYKGVAQAINNTPAGKLDNIRDTLGDIRENLGKALLDSISPALDALYNKLQDISNWIAENTDSRVNEIKNKIVKAAKKGGQADLSAYSAEELEAAVKSANWNNANSIKIFGMDLAPLANYAAINVRNQVFKELEARGYVSSSSASGGSNYGETSTNSVATTVAAAENALASFLKSYGNSSLSYIERGYTAIIGEAESFLATLNTSTTEEQVALLKEAGFENVSPNRVIGYLNDIVAEYTDKIDSLYATEEKAIVSPIEEALKQFGGLSKSFNVKGLEDQIASLTALQSTADGDNAVFFGEIIEALNSQLDELKNPKPVEVDPRSFLDDLADKLKRFINPYGEEGTTYTLFGKDMFAVDDDQATAAANALMNTAISNMGEAGEVVSNLAQNMLTMGPAIGAIVTALQYVIEGFMEVMGPALEEFVSYGLEPIKEIGRVIADIVMPIMDEIMPSIKQSADFLIGIFDMIGMVLKPIVSFLSSFLAPILDTIIALLQILEGPLKLVAKGLSAVGETLGWLGDWIRHIMAVVVNWMASWIPWISGMNDPGEPQNLGTRIQNSWDNIDNAFNSGTAEGTSTTSAVQNASYTGGTNVTINIYQEAPVVGEGGMMEFALMIRNKLVESDYLGR